MPVPSCKLRLALADGWPRQVLLFLVAYLVYGASRWDMTGDEASNHAYLAAQVGVVPAALMSLYRRDRLSYRRLRDTVLATWLLALPVFWLLPVARPRLAELGIADTSPAWAPVATALAAYNASRTSENKTAVENARQ